MLKLLTDALDSSIHLSEEEWHLEAYSISNYWEQTGNKYKRDYNMRINNDNSKHYRLFLRSHLEKCVKTGVYMYIYKTITPLLGLYNQISYGNIVKSTR